VNFRRRVILAEHMDDESPDVAARSMADIEWINRWMGGNEVTRRLLKQAALGQPFTVLDVGAGGGQMGRVMRQACPNADVTSLDYRAHQLRKAEGRRVAADAFRLPFNPKSFDIVFCSLFLHHFEDDDVVRLLREFSNAARDAVLINDLERHALSYYFLPATRWILGWQQLTLHDGPVSVRASFKEEELRLLCERAGLRVANSFTSRPPFRIGVVARP
jgi:2-polyprenyl-3-methyl-5-hydroxy-6-metoxy-1,4-benzoquinol methylase